MYCNLVPSHRLVEPTKYPCDYHNPYLANLDTNLAKKGAPHCGQSMGNNSELGSKGEEEEHDDMTGRDR